MFSLIPLPYRLLGMVLAVAGVFGVGYYKGHHASEMAWEVKSAQAQREADQRAFKMREDSYTIENKIVQTITKENTVYVERKVYIHDIPDLPIPGAFRLFHDASARGLPIDTTAASGPNAAPTTLEDIASTVDDNYHTCRNDQARLAALQEYVREIQRDSR